MTASPSPPSPALLDLAETLDARGLERAFEEADRLRLLHIPTLNSLCERSPGRRGLKALRPLLEREQHTAPHTRSELERDFAALCRREGLPHPALNTLVAGFEVDAAWPDANLVVELDGFTFHRTRTAFERDRARDAALLLAGHRVLRITARRLEREPAAVAEAVRRLLEVP